ncbi:DUF2752 domain-containing protein [Paenibacillus glacialis]|uniref:DUF2752 domain-containing protein n=1 Tax=Paenibacillus glacialis TaxID=494026 RepID=A0A168EL03_9BACL|nr:DUF2752 domain-containing protein [Paenibacillus glacialis]OAB35296.1 hypothetical protein PGLA_22075 [Paenibacillus glacialis]
MHFKCTFDPKKHPILSWGVSLGVGGLLYLKVWLPMTNIGIPCVFNELTGFYCPGCGITRAVLSLLRLDVIQAFRYNPLVFILLPLYAMYFITKKKKMPTLSNGIMALMLIMTLAFGVLRNIPMFDFLAPTIIR